MDPTTGRQQLSCLRLRMELSSTSLRIHPIIPTRNSSYSVKAPTNATAPKPSLLFSGFSKHLPRRHEQRSQGPHPRLPQRTIFDSLNDNGLSFGIYYQNIPATLFFKSLRKIKNVLKFHSYALKFKRHALKGKLPNYVVVEQRYFDVKVSPANDDHPSHDVAVGQRFEKEVSLRQK